MKKNVSAMEIAMTESSKGRKGLLVILRKQIEEVKRID